MHSEMLELVTAGKDLHWMSFLLALAVPPYVLFCTTSQMHAKMYKADFWEAVLDLERARQNSVMHQCPRFSHVYKFL